MAASAPSVSPQAGLFSVLGLNVFLLIVFGVGSSAWLLLFTDWFPEIGGLLALTGAFSWLAFVSKILPQDRIEGFQAWACEKFLSRVWFTLLILVLLVGGVVLGTFRGTVELQSVQESADRSVKIASDCDARIDPELLPPGGRLRKNLWTSLTTPAQYCLKVGGYPDQIVTVHPWRVEKRFVSSSFLRPVLLLRPSPALYDKSHHSAKNLYVTLDGKSYGPVTFTGQAIWVGCDEDVFVPPQLQDRWRAQLVLRPSMIYDWLYPQAFPRGPRELSKGTKVVVKVVFPETNEVVGGAEDTVQPVQSKLTFPQEVVLDEKRTPAPSG